MEPPSPPRSGRSAVAPLQPAPAPPPSPPPPPPPRATRPSAPRGRALLAGRRGSLRPGEVPAAGRRGRRAGPRASPAGSRASSAGRRVPGSSLQAGGGMESGEADLAPSRPEELGLPRPGGEARAARVRSGWDGGLRPELLQCGAAGMAASDWSSGDRSCGDGGLRRELWGLRPLTVTGAGNGSLSLELLR